MSAYPRTVIYQCLIDIGLFVAILLIVIISFGASYDAMFGRADWLQRSGSLAVVFAAIIEYRHLYVYSGNYAHRSAMSGELRGPHVNFVAKLRYMVGKSAIYIVLIGTFVWGYGDLPFTV